jgi:predicted Zn-dependent protease
MGEPARAIPLLMQALSQYPKRDDAIFEDLGSAYLALGDNDAAIEWLLKSVDENTQIVDPYWGLAVAYSNEGDRVNAARFVAEYQRRATELGFKAIQSYVLRPEVLRLM